MIFFVLSICYYISFYDFGLLYFFQVGFWFLFLRVLFFGGWLFLCLAENNRTPFDFSEGESELVSGFNVDYGGGLFSLIFICEYGMIIFLCFFLFCFFAGGVTFYSRFLGFVFFMFGCVAAFLVIVMIFWWVGPGSSCSLFLCFFCWSFWCFILSFLEKILC